MVKPRQTVGINRRTHFAPTALLRPARSPASVAESDGSLSIAFMIRARWTWRMGAVCERARRWTCYSSDGVRERRTIRVDMAKPG